MARRRRSLTAPAERRAAEHGAQTPTPGLTNDVKD